MYIVVAGCPRGCEPWGEEDREQQGAEPGPSRGPSGPGHRHRGGLRERGRGTYTSQQ